MCVCVLVDIDTLEKIIKQIKSHSYIKRERKAISSTPCQADRMVGLADHVLLIIAP